MPLSLCVLGVNTMANYELVLHLIRYKNWHTEALFDRKFKLVCSELNGRYISNDFKVEVLTDLWAFHQCVCSRTDVVVEDSRSVFLKRSPFRGLPLTLTVYKYSICKG